MEQKVLIVEDNPLNMKLFSDLVEACGYSSIEARSGLSALPLALENRPALILMDVQLPEISGLDLIQQFKKHEDLRTIPIIAVTAFAMKGDEQRIRASSCDEYVSKPISIMPFMAMIKSFLERK